MIPQRSQWTEAEQPDSKRSPIDDRYSSIEAAAAAPSVQVLAELLDTEGWSDVLGTYARTMGLAVAMTDCEGSLLGLCHNAQPAWLLAHGAQSESVSGIRCSFCVDSLATPCQAVRTALLTNRVELVHDRSGLVHLAVPVSLGQHKLGALIAGQVFDRYPEPLPLQQLARRLGISAAQLWHEARLQAPIRNATLRVYGELLFSLSKAYLRQRYSAILDRNLERVNLRLRHAVDGIKEHALFTVDGFGAVTSWNLGAECLFGHKESDIIGQNFSCLFPEEDIQKGIPGKLLQKAGDEGGITDKGWQVRKDGTRFFSEGTLAALGEGAFREFGRLTHDVTGQRSAEEALRQTQRLESIGILASGIAHDFNNLLHGIKGGVGLAMTALPLDHPAYPSLVIADKASEKAAELTHQLLAYAGQGKFIVTRFNLSVSIREMLSLLRISISKSVDLQLELEPELPWIEGDASQIQQVIMNLVINGAEAIGKEVGWLRVSTRTASVGERAVEHTGAEGAEVCLEVRDSGPGMTDEIKTRIFDPFFTTKFSGRGLGLAAVSGIVRGHGGRMRVESSPGSGTTFQIYFPAVEKSTLVQEKPSTQTSSPCSGVILVVDDERILRTLARTILERKGYQVLEAENGREAVEIFRQNASSITAILLDMTMPTMGGDKAFPLLRAIRSDVPILISTGYSQVTTELLGTHEAFGVIQKPYKPTQLCEAIARVQDVPTEVRRDDDRQNA